jgi:hypothetical protein
MTDQYVCQNCNCSTCGGNAAAPSNCQCIDCACSPVNCACTTQNTYAAS